MTPVWSDKERVDITNGSVAGDILLQGFNTSQLVRLDERAAQSALVFPGCYKVLTLSVLPNWILVTVRKLVFDVDARCLHCSVTGSIDGYDSSPFFADDDGAVVCCACDNAGRDGTDVVPHRG